MAAVVEAIALLEALHESLALQRAAPGRCKELQAGATEQAVAVADTAAAQQRVKPQSLVGSTMLRVYQP